MLKCANLDYDYGNDDIITDVISSFAVIAFGIGEILGPIYTGFISEVFGTEDLCNLAAAMTFALALVYSVGSGVVLSWFRIGGYKRDSLISTKIIPEAIA